MTPPATDRASFCQAIASVADGNTADVLALIRHYDALAAKLAKCEEWGEQHDKDTSQAIDALRAELATWKERAEANQQKYENQCAGAWSRMEEVQALRRDLESVTAERDRLRAALRKIRGFNDTWAHRGHEPYEVGHECRMCWIMRTVDTTLAAAPVEGK